MMNKSDTNARAGRTTIYVGLIFLVLTVSLQLLVWLYWDKILEPRLRLEAASQANVLAHSQEVRLVDAILAGNGQNLHRLRETIDEILLFKGPNSDEPLFLGLELEIDYDVVPSSPGSLDLKLGKKCPGCFVSEVGLYSHLSDELIGIARFHVSDRLFRHLSRDVRKTLFSQSLLGTVLLLFVGAVVMLLIREINRSRRQAESANRSKSAFLANMSHELRTPLNAIIGFSELMGFDTKIPGQHRKHLAIINRSGEYLLELINDVLELSKIEAAQDKLMETAFDLHDALERVMEMIRLHAEKKNLQLILEREKDVPRYIKTDERKLRQILLNLLGNAVKFTGEGGVTLRVRRVINREPGNGDGTLVLQFEVQDSGPGIAPEEVSGIFEAFTQTQGGYDKKEGAGLGLAISRQFVRHLGGEIQVNSDEGRGAVFAFTLPVRPSAGSDLESHRPARRVVGLKSNRDDGRIPEYRILVVDDNSENRVLLRLLLDRVGFVVETAENGRRAVQVNETWQPHLIWMDMRMPVMDGYEATQAIHQASADRQAKPPVIIALTASAFNEDRDAVLAAGCDDFVRRPFKEHEIFEKMAEHLGAVFVYDSHDTGVPRTSASRCLSTGAFKSAIDGLPGSIVHELKTAIELSDMDRMEQAVAKVDEGHAALAAELRTLIDSFQFDRLLSILNEMDDAPS